MPQARSGCCMETQHVRTSPGTAHSAPILVTGSCDERSVLRAGKKRGEKNVGRHTRAEILVVARQRPTVRTFRSVSAVTAISRKRTNLYLSSLGSNSEFLLLLSLLLLLLFIPRTGSSHILRTRRRLSSRATNRRTRVNWNVTFSGVDSMIYHVGDFCKIHFAHSVSNCVFC